ncbi:phosphatidylglycerophosphatase and protein-tyrosine phosphatase 1 isoform X1 [Hemicordylus capensis]|uniref:phosphatidylglycerophosphatase and protein-tyrosine phosphatase 1 isoform X1 n=1 Tax=Hemicordylus capensis TaxID=884348 RepID=UPI00230444D3|nr:phosphatidylglycerophosphatase and protein-tyrosine phosphatase 1 isoform X1 [Hemicordylus capensis]
MAALPGETITSQETGAQTEEGKRAHARDRKNPPPPCSNPNERARRRRPLLRQQSDQHGSLAKDEPISPAQRSPATPRSLARNELLQRPAPGLSHETPGALSAAMVVLLPTLGPVAARLVFYPTLLYTLVRERLPGLQRPWFSRIDHAVILGALPLRGRCRQLVEDENVRGVLTMNEEYETRFLCWSLQEWEAMGVEQLRLSTVDLTGVPSLENLHKGVKFVLKHRDCGNSVYVHCKAGRFRSATMVAAYLIQLHQWTPQEAIEAIVKIRPHIIIRQKQVQLLEDFHRSLSVAVPVEAQHNLPARQQKPQETQQEQKPLEAKQDATLKTPGS